MNNDESSKIEDNSNYSDKEMSKDDDDNHTSKEVDGINNKIKEWYGNDSVVVEELHGEFVCMVDDDVAGQGEAGHHRETLLSGRDNNKFTIANRDITSLDRSQDQVESQYY